MGSTADVKSNAKLQCAVVYNVGMFLMLGCNRFYCLVEYLIFGCCRLCGIVNFLILSRLWLQLLS